MLELAHASDADLLAAWEQGDRAAGSELVERHYESVYRFFRNKVGGHDQLEDLVQQTFLGCIEARRRFQHRCTFRTFVLAIARHQLYAHFRSHARRRESDFTVTSLQDIGTSPSAQVARKQDTRLLGEALQRIPLEAQIALELAYWEGITGPELAVILDVPLETAYSRLRRAKVLLRDALFAPGVANAPNAQERETFEAWLHSANRIVRDVPEA